MVGSVQNDEEHGQGACERVALVFYLKKIGSNTLRFRILAGRLELATAY